MVVRIAVVLLLLALLPSTAFADKRVALVIGNSAYKNAGELANPKNDATDMAIALKKLNFQVIDGFDLDKAGLDRKIHDFAVALSGAEAGVFFYAGHGLQIAGKNYLVPVDAELTTAEALEFEMVQVDVVHRIMEGKTSTNVLFLDACRNNPLARNLARAMGTRSAEVGRGLAPVESGVGTPISFSTQPGNVALDGKGRNSPFAGALVKRLASSSDDLSALLIDVRNDVRKETEGKQVPWEHSALTGRFYFNAKTPEKATVAPPQASEAEQTWTWMKNTTDQAILENFIKRFGDTPFGPMARARLADLKKPQVAVALPPPTAKPAPAKPIEPGVAITPAPPPKSDPPKPAVAINTTPAGCDGVEAQFGNERRCLKPKDSFKDCPDCPEMVVIPAGAFTMGSPWDEAERSGDEGPQHKVTISRPFAVGKFEVTFAEWAACGDGGGCAGNKNPSDQGWGRTRRPVINVSWDDAKQYVSWLGKKTGRAYRLLSEAEWEYAARAGTTTPFSTGRTITTDQANFGNTDMSAKGIVRQKTIEVGSLNKPNAFGLHDMHGNVWEWVEDCYKDNYGGAPTDGRAVADTSSCSSVLRGGSWVNNPLDLRSAVRFSKLPDFRSMFIGFRVARTLSVP